MSLSTKVIPIEAIEKGDLIQINRPNDSGSSYWETIITIDPTTSTIIPVIEFMTRRYGNDVRIVRQTRNRIKFDAPIESDRD
jgi:hypothetical protein